MSEGFAIMGGSVSITDLEGLPMGEKRQKKETKKPKVEKKNAENLPPHLRPKPAK